MKKEPLLISACLLGVRCRYDGGGQYLPAVTRLMERYDLIPVCPELQGGLPVPRPPSEISGDRVISKEGDDVTEQFMRGAVRALETARGFGVKRALLKSGSPSCGMDKVYDGTFSGRLVPGRGLTAALLMENGIEVFSERHVPDPGPGEAAESVEGPVVVYTTGDYAEAALMKSLLESSGITCLMLGANAHSTAGYTSGILVQIRLAVHASQAGHARAVIAEAQKGAADGS